MRASQWGRVVGPLDSLKFHFFFLVPHSLDKVPIFNTNTLFPNDSLIKASESNLVALGFLFLGLGFCSLNFGKVPCFIIRSRFPSRDG